MRPFFRLQNQNAHIPGVMMNGGPITAPATHARLVEPDFETYIEEGGVEVGPTAKAALMSRQ